MDNFRKLHPTHRLKRALPKRVTSWSSAPDNFVLAKGAKVELVKEEGRYAHIFCGGAMTRVVPRSDLELLEEEATS